MKKRINNLLNWFEEHFNYYIEFLAFVGGLFCLLFSVAIFIIMLIDVTIFENLRFEVVLLPGFIAFFGVIILFALRITRYLTK